MESMNLLWFEYALQQFMCWDVNSQCGIEILSRVQQDPAGGVWTIELGNEMNQCLLCFQCDLSPKYS